ncbi:hypothetical protein R3P38DRAFT_3344341 [Favolaschia claudopus]|uniref:Uncharacterized protein n=1 Tax=Favolaschia claudopus TaxID=2862362 RepID=A0AAW0DIT5_9AGAR
MQRLQLATPAAGLNRTQFCRRGIDSRHIQTAIRSPVLALEGKEKDFTQSQVDMPRSPCCILNGYIHQFKLKLRRRHSQSIGVRSGDGKPQQFVEKSKIKTKNPGRRGTGSGRAYRASRAHRSSHSASSLAAWLASDQKNESTWVGSASRDSVSKGCTPELRKQRDCDCDGAKARQDEERRRRRKGENRNGDAMQRLSRDLQSPDAAKRAQDTRCVAIRMDNGKNRMLKNPSKSAAVYVGITWDEMRPRLNPARLLFGKNNRAEQHPNFGEDKGIESFLIRRQTIETRPIQTTPCYDDAEIDIQINDVYVDVGAKIEVCAACSTTESEVDGEEERAWTGSREPSTSAIYEVPD